MEVGKCFLPTEEKSWLLDAWASFEISSPKSIILNELQAKRRTLEQELGTLDRFLFNPENADVTLVVNNGQESIIAHSKILRTFSEYFELLFGSGMKECKTLVVEKPNWTIATLKLILTFLYTQTVNVPIVQLLELYKAADEIQLNTLLHLIKNHDYSTPQDLDLAGYLMQLFSEAPENKSLKLCLDYFEFCGQDTAKFQFLLHTEHKEGLRNKRTTPIFVVKESKEETVNLGSQEKDSDIWGKEILYTFLVPEKHLAELCFKNICRLSTASKSFSTKTFSEQNISIRAISKFLIGFRKGINIGEARLCLHSKASIGYYLGGSNEVNVLTVEGTPGSIVQAIQVVKENFRLEFSRASLRITAPKFETFCHIFNTQKRFGYDLKANAMFLIRPLEELQQILKQFEHPQKICQEPQIPRKIVALNYPLDPRVCSDPFV